MRIVDQHDVVMFCNMVVYKSVRYHTTPFKTSIFEQQDDNMFLAKDFMFFIWHDRSYMA